MKQKVTIRDVADYVGVSRATVSYVLNGVNKVSEETKQKVMQAIKELNYQPDFTAISLSKKKSNMIGIMVPFDDKSKVFKQNLYYSELIGGMEYTARKNEYDLMITGIREPKESINWVIRRNLDGLIFSRLMPEKLLEELIDLEIPVVLIDNYEEYGRIFHNVRIDDELGGYLGAKHLLELGHTNICFVAHNLHEGSVDRTRIRGIEKAFQEANLTFRHEMIFDAKGSSLENGYKIGKKLLQTNHNLTGVFASSDILALGIINAFTEFGKHVPQDYSVVGFDDLEISHYSSPKLTTIKQDVFHKGILAAQTLVDAIEKKIVNPVHITLPVELMIRDSTNPLM